MDKQKRKQQPRTSILKSKMLRRIVIFFTVVFLIVFFFIRIEGFFVRFDNEREVENFLLENLEMGMSTAEDIEGFMQQYLVDFERCSIYSSSEIPRSNRVLENFDEEFLNCEVFSHTAWRFYPVTQYYIIDFYFSDARLQDVTVDDYFLGP